MATWKINLSHVSASELGTNQPWIPGPLQVVADYYDMRGVFLEFKNTNGQVVYCVRQEMIREIIREEGGAVHKCAPRNTKEG